jgi:hypothetical protein
MPFHEFRVHGTILDLPTHLAALGLAAMLPGGRAWWSPDYSSAWVRTTAGQDDAEAIIEERLKSVVTPGGWLLPKELTDNQPDGVPTIKGTTLPLSPFHLKLGQPAQSKLRARTEGRSAALDKVAHPLDRAVVHALGQPSYSADPGRLPKLTPAHGGTGLLGRVKNTQYLDFVLCNIVEPACAVGLLVMTTDQIMQWITTGDGAAAKQSDGQTSLSDWSMWRTPVVLVAAGLYGLALFPPEHVLENVNVESKQVQALVSKTPALADKLKDTPGGAGVSSRYAQRLTLPVFTRPVSPQKYSAIITDAGWLGTKNSDIRWKREQGVHATVTFPVQYWSGGALGGECGVFGRAQAPELV